MTKHSNIFSYIIVIIGMLTTFFSATCEAGPKFGTKLSMFAPFLFENVQYERNKGFVLNTQVFLDFGVTKLQIFPTSLEILPIWDIPDVKRRIRITLSDPLPLNHPNGDVVINGYTYNYVEQSATWVTAAVSETLSFSTSQSIITSTYFDSIESISTPGLGIDSSLTVEWWIGQEQEIPVSAIIDDVDATSCEDYAVIFNGQQAAAFWDAGFENCKAETELYFPIAPGDESDEFISYPGGIYSWSGYLSMIGNLALFFDVHTGNDAFIRPVVMSLMEVSSGQIIDQNRVLFTLPTDSHGNPGLIAKPSATETAGAFLQLTPSGLDRLGKTHATTLPFPSLGGDQPRISETAINQSSHYGTPASGAMEISVADDDYFTDANAPGPEWHGYLAYQEILKDAIKKNKKFNKELVNCGKKPNPLAAAFCTTNVIQNHCVRLPPMPKDFIVKVEGLTTFYDPTHSLDALTIGSVEDMDLEFGVNEIVANFVLEDIHGWFEGKINPNDVSIHYKTILPVDPCTIKPDPVVLSAFTANAEDHQGWLTCPAMELFTETGTPLTPVKFELQYNGESFTTPFISTPVTFLLEDTEYSGGSGICGELWMNELVEQEMLAWVPATGTVIAGDWSIPNGQDEAMNRLLSPLELGIEHVDIVPPDTHPYDVHPLEQYELKAAIGPTPLDAYGANSNSTDGLYLPFITQALEKEADPYLSWFCLDGFNHTCNATNDLHFTPFPEGLDPNGESFDIGMTLTTGHINQTLWAHARLPENLGSKIQPRFLELEPTAIVDLAEERGYTDLLSALNAAGTEMDIRIIHKAAPYTLIGDGEGSNKLLYITPNLELSLMANQSDGTQTEVAKFMVDFIERDLQIFLGTGGQKTLQANWSDLHIYSLTTEFLNDCYGNINSSLAMRSCANDLQEIIGEVAAEPIKQTLLEMITAQATPQKFDATQLSPEIRQIWNPRTFYINQTVNLLGNLCNAISVKCIQSKDPLEIDIGDIGSLP